MVLAADAGGGADALVLRTFCASCWCTCQGEARGRRYLFLFLGGGRLTADERGHPDASVVAGVLHYLLVYLSGLGCGSRCCAR